MHAPSKQSRIGMYGYCVLMLGVSASGGNLTPRSSNNSTSARLRGTVGGTPGSAELMSTAHCGVAVDTAAHTHRESKCVMGHELHTVKQWPLGCATCEIVTQLGRLHTRPGMKCAVHELLPPDTMQKWIAVMWSDNCGTSWRTNTIGHAVWQTHALTSNSTQPTASGCQGVGGRARAAAGAPRIQTAGGCRASGAPLTGAINIALASKAIEYCNRQCSK